MLASILLPVLLLGLSVRLQPVGAATYTALGDSYSAGYAASTPANGFVPQVNNFLNATRGSWQLVNRGITSYTSLQVRDDPAALSGAIADNPNLITVLVGINDVIQSSQATESPALLQTRFQNAYNTIISRARNETHAFVIAATIPDISRIPAASKWSPARRALAQQGTLAVNAAITNVAVNYGIPVVDLFTDRAAYHPYNPNNFHDDGYHPNDVGYFYMARLFAAELASLLVVSTISDSGPGSLRQAMLDANAHPNTAGLDAIQFNIPGGGLHTITPLTTLPDISEPVIMDGYTQPGARPNTATSGDNSVFQIQLSGSAAGVVNGLTIRSGNCIIEGLVINRFGSSGIALFSRGNNIIAGNIIGANVSGTAAPNAGAGILVATASNIIGGELSGQRNIISGNGLSGILISGDNVTNNLVQGNLITNNGGDGITLMGSSTVGNRLQRNVVYLNGGLGIDFNDDGVTGNDGDDADMGPNNLQNFPVITAMSSAGTNTNISGMLKSTPNNTFTVELFSNAATDPSGFGEGQTYSGSQDVSTDSNGNALFNISVPSALAGQSFTATAMNRVSGDSSEFSQSFSQQTFSLGVAPDFFNEDGGSNAATGVVSRNAFIASDLTVILNSSNVNKVIVPPIVVIPAGVSSATFPITALDNDLVDGPQSITLSATAVGSLTATKVVSVIDNETSILVVRLNPEQANEGAGANAITGSVFCNIPPGVPQIINLSSSDSSLVKVPATITIPAGATTAAFPITILDNALATGQQSVVITASQAGSFTGTATLIVADNDIPSLELSLTSDKVTQGKSINATVTRNTSIDTELIVNLSSTNTTTVTMPAVVTIPAGQIAIAFPINAVDNSLINGSQSITITASAEGLRAAIAILLVAENEPPGIRLSASPVRISEGAGEAASLGTITRNTSLDTPLVVTLTSSHPDAARVSPTVTIPAGAPSVSFLINAVDDAIVNGDHSVNISATAGSFSTRLTLTLLDDDEPQFALIMSAARLGEGGGATAATGRVQRNTPARTSLRVQLASDRRDKLSMPATVIIPAGATEASFAIRAIDDSLADGSQLVTIWAVAPGFTSAAIPITVLDNESASRLSIRGRVVTAVPDATRAVQQVGLGGVTLRLFSGRVLRDIVVADNTGAYQFDKLPAGTYTVTADKAHYDLLPASRTVSLTTSDVTKINFGGVAQTSISGRVVSRRADGSLSAVAGIALIARSATGVLTVFTRNDGRFVIDNPPLDTYLLLPGMVGTYCLPATRSVALTPAAPVANDLIFQVAGADIIAPTLTISAPRPITYTTAGQPVRVVGAARDTGGAGVAFVTVALARFNSATATTPSTLYNWNTKTFVAGDDSLKVEKLATGTTNWRLEGLPPLSPGFYGLRATAIDGADNVGRSTFIRFRINASSQSGTKADSGNLISAVALSTIKATAATSSVHLRFDRPIDGASASDPTRYNVWINGTPVIIEAAAYNSLTHSVTLSLAEGTWHVGAIVKVSWNGLQDASGKLSVGHSQILTAP